MNISKSITVCFSKFGTFKGRATRSEFWWFFLFVLLMQWALSIVESTSLIANPHLAPSDPYEELGMELVDLLILLPLWIPRYAAGARRLHDVGRSGWWQLLEITIIGMIPLYIWMARDGDRATNEYGPPPLL
jgi:uncharacterized membrane protein YhaH (DUF805 family)